MYNVIMHEIICSKKAKRALLHLLIIATFLHASIIKQKNHYIIRSAARELAWFP